MKPDFSNLKVFGFIAVLHIPKPKRKKLAEKSKECTHLGYLSNTKGYWFLENVSKKIVKGRDVTFIENQMASEKLIHIPAEPILTNNSKKHLVSDEKPDKMQII